MGPWSQALREAVGGIEPGDVVLLPDLFVDRVVPVPETDAFDEACLRARERGGGNVLQAPQSHRVGGTAANTALALATLGAPAGLVAATDPVGAALLEEEAPDALDRTGVRVGEAGACTVALEHGDPVAANVMVSDPGPVADFDGAALEARDRERVREARCVLVASWGLAGEAGTDLLEAVADAARAGGTRLAVDPGDPGPSRDDLDGLLASPALEAVDRWMVNADEARTLAEAAGAGGGDLAAAARGLAEATGAAVDAHDEARAGTTGSGEWVEAPALEADARVRTGAGDAWNAGNLLGLLAGLDDGARLDLAHAVAAAHLEEGRGGWGLRDVARRLEDGGRSPP